MKCYKGFDKNLACRGFKYEVGKEYATETAEICESGFHACENPFDVFNYYPPSDSRFCEVDLDANDQSGDDSKRVGKHIRIEAEIGLRGLIAAGVKFILDKVDWNNAKESNEGDRSASTNTGNQSAATNTGDWSAATNTGYQSAATNTGDWSAATNTGYQSAATNTGYQSAATVKGKDSIAIVTGYQSKAKGSLGCWIVLTERDEEMHILDVKAVRVDGVEIKEDTFYILKNGKVEEVED